MRKKLSYRNETTGRDVVTECTGNIFQTLMAVSLSGIKLSHVTITQY